MRILREILVTILTPQILILPKSSPNKYYFLAEYCNLQKNIGPVEDSMADAISWAVLERFSSNLTNKVYTNVEPLSRHVVEQIPVGECL
jgi:hypothetical protein